MKFTSILLAAGLFITSAVAQTVAVIEADLVTISSQATTLDNDLHAFPTSGGTLAAALKLHSDATTLTSTINTATTHVQATPGPISSSDAQIITASIQALVPIFKDIINFLQSKKPYISAVAGSSYLAIIKQDIINLRNAIYAYLNALIAIFPIIWIDPITTARDDIDSAFASAIASW